MEMKSPDVMIFEPNTGGHHAEFTCHLMRYWLDNVRDGRLLAAVAPGLLEQQPQMSAGVVLPPRTDRAELEAPLPGSQSSLWFKGRINRKLLTEAIERHRPKHVLVMYLDHAQLALASGLRFQFPVSISGILFHPTLHYRGDGSINPKSFLQGLRKRLVLRSIARNPHLSTVFTLDPTAVPSLRALGLDAVALPDPVAQDGFKCGTSQQMREHFDLAPDRTTLLLFGSLTARKGVTQALEALALLGPEEARQVALLMAGPLDPALHPLVEALVSKVRACGVQVAHHNAYIENYAVQSFMGAAHLILVPYQRHFGSSAVLIRAALAGRPVVSQEYGLMGANVRTHCLGQAVDTGRPKEIAGAISRFLRDPRVGFDPEVARDFARANTPELFCRTIIDRLVPSFSRS
jgi:glycosyltransferase involved in cell wall biosynthesis